MGRIRTIKPEFFRHEGLFDAEQEFQLPLRLSFAALWTVCDREGRFKWRPRSLKAECLPHDDIDFSRVLDALWTRGFLVKYGYGTDVYGWVPTFKDHQFINNRELKSHLPEPNENNILTREARVDDANSTRLYLDKGEHIKGTYIGKGKGNKNTRQARVSDASPTDILSEILPAEIAAAVVEHRAKLKSPLTAHAAKLLAQQFLTTGIPLEAAEEMIARGWRGIKPSWFNGNSHAPDQPKHKDPYIAALHKIMEKQANDEGKSSRANGVDPDLPTLVGNAITGSKRD